MKKIHLCRHFAPGKVQVSTIFSPLERYEYTPSFRSWKGTSIPHLFATGKVPVYPIFSPPERYKYTPSLRLWKGNSPSSLRSKIILATPRKSQVETDLSSVAPGAEQRSLQDAPPSHSCAPGRRTVGRPCADRWAGCPAMSGRKYQGRREDDCGAREKFLSPGPQETRGYPPTGNSIISRGSGFTGNRF
jgi:hypothetical protein